jgi:hypothetical protein
LALTLLWISIGTAAAFVAKHLLLRILLLLTAAGVTFHILSLKTAE